MSKKCINPKYSEMLYAYELGLLNEDETRQLEIHLIECEACFEQAGKFEQAAELLRHSEEVKAAVLKEAESYKTDSDKRNRYKTGILPAFIAVAALITLFIISPWKINITSDEAIAGNNRLTVLTFENSSPVEASQNLGEIVTNLLITNLSESRFIDVISYQHLEHLRQYFELENKDITLPDFAANLKKITNANWIISGNILQAEPVYIITSQISDISTGKVVSTQKVSGKPEEDIFSVVDRLTKKVKDDLILPDNALKEQLRSLHQMTTGSIEAYRYYIEGVKYRDMLFLDKAAECFDNAIKYDSSFAMAYYHLYLMGRGNYLKDAIRYIANCSSEEKVLIKVEEAIMFGDDTYAHLLLEQGLKDYPLSIDILQRIAQLESSENHFDSSIAYYNQIIALDSLNKIALNNLAYEYSKNDEYDKALETIDLYIAVAPNEPNPYDSKGHLQSKNGEIEKAIDSYKKALQIKPDYIYSLRNIIEMYIISEKNDSAGYYIAIMKEYGGKYKSEAYFSEAVLRLAQGETEKSIKILKEGLAFDEKNNYYIGLLNKYRLRSKIYALRSDYKASNTDIESCQAIYNQLGRYDVLGYKHVIAAQEALSGEIDMAREKAEAIKKLTFAQYQSFDFATYGYSYVMAAVATAEQDFENALQYNLIVDSIQRTYDTQFSLAVTYFNLSDFENTLNILNNIYRYQKTLQLISILDEIKTDYYIGKSYEQLGMYDQAKKHYQTILRRWSNLDTPVEEYRLAQESYDRLIQ